MDGTDFLKDIIIPLVGIGAGVFTTKWVTNSWQIRKETNDLKREIISDYEKSLKHNGMLTTMFFYKIYNSYIDWSKIKDNQEDLDKYIVFPKDEKDLPFHKFEKEYRQYLEEYDQARFIATRFVSDLRYYYDNPELISNERYVSTSNNNLRQLIRRIMYCNDGEAYLSLINDYSEEDRTNDRIIEEFEYALIRTPIKLKK